MPRDRAVDFVWVSLALLFFALAGAHVYLAATSVLKMELPKKNALARPGMTAPAAEVLEVFNQEISSVVNTFILSYNRSSRMSNVFGACGYAVAGLTCVFCLVLNRKSP